MSKKSNLIIIEGPDRIGKDSVLDEFGEDYNFHVFKKIFKTGEVPNYRTDIKGFIEYNNEYYHREFEELLTCSQMYENIIIARLFTTEFVYSSLFNRPSIINEVYKWYKDYFELKQLIMLFPSYKKYLKRSIDSGHGKEYSEEEHNIVTQLYLKSPFNNEIQTVISIDPTESKELPISIIKGLVNEK